MTDISASAARPAFNWRVVDIVVAALRAPKNSAAWRSTKGKRDFTVFDPVCASDVRSNV